LDVKLGSWIRQLPWSIVGCAIALIALGLLGIARVETLTGGNGRFFQQQAAYAVLAVLAMVAVSLTNYRVLGRYSYLFFGVTILLLVAVYLFPAVNRAHRWIRLGPLGLQPSELAKIMFILAMAKYLMYRENYRRFRGLAAPLAITLVPVLLILKEPDLGTSLVFLPVLFAMLFAAGARRRDLWGVVLLGIAVLPVLWMQMSVEQKSRITALLDQPPPGQRPSDTAYHLYQAKQMRAMGGVWGSSVTGSLSDDPAAYRLPEAQSDFIICVLGDRFGLPGLALVFAIYTLFVWRGLAIAVATREPFGRLLAVGISALFAVEVVIHTGMSVGLLPITGISLPLVSHGGSGLLSHAIAVGLLLNVGLRPGYEMVNEPFRYVENA
jgi:cell division protein FtsW (lipid II flippase)